MSPHFATKFYDLLRPLLFKLDAELAHQVVFSLLDQLGRTDRIPQLGAELTSASHPALERHIMGLHLANPIGLAAGFDKNARLLHVWPWLGFGFVEIGTVTPRPQAGNDRPRLFRLPQDRALVNRMGFNNEGVEAVARRLEHREQPLVIGANIGKNKDTPNDEAVNDYVACFDRLQGLAHYFVVNVSSPNTPGLRALQDKEPLRRILLSLQSRNKNLAPLLLKIAPDLNEAQLEDIAALVEECNLAGLVATNTTISRDNLATAAPAVEQLGAGGLSGAPLTRRSRSVVLQLRQLCGPRPAIIGVGGIMQGADAAAMLAAGADLVQLYSGYVYSGPMLVPQIARHLVNIDLRPRPCEG